MLDNKFNSTVIQQVLMEFIIYATTSVLQDLGNLKCLKVCDSK